MKYFNSIEAKPVETLQPAPVRDSSVFIKRNLLKLITRAELYSQIEGWLMSFEGALTKQSFEAQMKRLDFDTDIALTQLQRANGRRIIPLPPPKKQPLLEITLIEAMLQDNFVAIYGRKFKQLIKPVVEELKSCGTVCVLEIEKLILNFKSYQDKGNAPKMIDDAISCDFLIIVNLEMPIHLEWHIREAIERIGRLRKEAKKPIISTWHRFNDCNKFFNDFKIYCVE